MDGATYEDATDGPVGLDDPAISSYILATLQKQAWIACEVGSEYLLGAYVGRDEGAIQEEVGTCNLRRGEAQVSVRQFFAPLRQLLFQFFTDGAIVGRIG